MASPRILAGCALLAAAGCGRLGFNLEGSADDGGPTGDAHAAGDGVPATGPLGPRYMRVLDNNASNALVAGYGGDVAVVESFTTTTTIAGKTIDGQAQYGSSGLVWFDATGTPGITSTLDSTSTCAIRQLASANQAVISVGYAQAGAAMPAYGACAIATGHQEGVAIQIGPDGAQQLGAHVVSSTFNTQTWFAAQFADGTLAVSGVYGGVAMIGTTALPAAGNDENEFYARIDPGTGMPSWTTALVSSNEIEAGPLDTYGDDACLIGSFSGTVTVLGTQLTALGSNDDWLARVDGTGAPRWVQQIGTTGNEGTPGAISVTATADGGCTAAVAAGGDLTIDAMSLPLAEGPAVLLHFDATGALVAGSRTPAAVQLARIADAVYGAIACTQPCTVGGATYTPVGSDIAVFSISDQGIGSVVAGIAGGATSLVELVAIPPDALALTFVAQSQTTLGSLSISPPASANALAVIGVLP